MNRTTTRIAAAVLGCVATVAISSAALANASSPVADVAVYIGWSGAECVALGEPDPTTDHTTIVATSICEPAQSKWMRYTVRPGQFFGVRMSSRTDVGLACEVDMAGKPLIKNSALGFVDCMGRW